jgi:tRNA A-37 threonylcarbamoyl transferase component Bud32
VSSSIIGQTLGNKYQILELIGQGGMATVYKAYQSGIDRYVAIKVLPPHPGQGAEFVQRFELEARTIARLQHPHILPVYDYGADGDILYLAVAYVAGGSLADVIDRGPMPLPKIEKYLKEISAALDYAHRQNVIHRDIKPDNVLLSGEDYALLADFGIAKLVGGDAKLTATGGLIGTPAYMSPEQAQGQVIGPAADIYSLGVVTYEMVTGQHPYQADTPLHVVMKHVTDPVPRITEVVSNVPPALESVMLRALAKSADDRYPSATALAQDFSRAIQGQAITVNVIPAKIDQPADTLALPPEETPTHVAPPAPPTMTPQPGTSGNSLVILGGMGVIAVLAVVVVLLVVFVLNQRSPVVVLAPTATRPPATATDIPATTAPTPIPIPTFGRATFSTANRIGDTINLRVTGLPPTRPGETYAVWMVNTATEDTLSIGALSIDGLGNGVFTYTDPDGRWLPGAFNALAITSEATISDDPAGSILYSTRFPADYGAALTAILVASEEGIDGSSLAQSALAEATLAQQHANLAADSTNIGGVLTHTEHTINILRGTEVDYNGNGRGENPSRSKLGVRYFLGVMEAQLDAGLAAPDISRALETEAELIRVCVTNAEHFLEDMLAAQNAVLEAESMEAAEANLATSTRFADLLVNGTDFDGSGQVDPFEGECSLAQLELFGVLALALDLYAGPLEAVE